MTTHLKALHKQHTRLYATLAKVTQNQDYPEEIGLVYMAGVTLPRIQIADGLVVDSTDVSITPPESVETQQTFYRRMSQAVMQVSPDITSNAHRARTLVEALGHRGALPLGVSVAPEGLTASVLWGDNEVWIKVDIQVVAE